MDDFFAYAARGTKTKYRRKPLVENGKYHVFNRRDDCAPVFLCDEDREDFVMAMRRLLGDEPYYDSRGNRYEPVGGGLTLRSYALLDDHYHLVLSQGDKYAMSSFMRRLIGSYTKRHNARHGRSGPVWDERYQAVPIESGLHMRRLIAYVHANPDSPLDDRWSSHRLYLDARRAGTEPWVDVKAGLAVYGDRGTYLEWFLRAVADRRRRNHNKGR